MEIDSTLIAIELTILLLIMAAWVVAALFIKWIIVNKDWIDSLFTENPFFYFIILVVVASICLNLFLYLLPKIESIL